MSTPSFNVTFKDYNSYQCKEVTKVVNFLMAYCMSETDSSIRISYKQVILNILKQAETRLQQLANKLEHKISGNDLSWLYVIRTRIDEISE